MNPITDGWREPTIIDTNTSQFFRNCSEWRSATAEGFRNAVLARNVMGCAPHGDAERAKLNSTAIVGALHDAVRAGRMFAFGYLPNAFIIEESKRGGQLYNFGHIGHPFREPYALFHTWDEGACGYIVVPDPDNPVLGAFTAAELLPITLHDRTNMLMVGDLATCVPIPQSTDPRRQFVLHCDPWHLRELMNDRPEAQMIREAGSNVFDPVMACLLLLATRGVPVDRVAAPDKLNRSRTKSGKPPIPPHWLVQTTDYVTAFGTRGQPRSAAERVDHGGSHASPVPHLRRGHRRTFADGRWTWVRDAVVNLRDPDAEVCRSFYELTEAARNAHLTASAFMSPKRR